MSLELSPLEISQLRSSWSIASGNSNKFVTKVYANLISDHPTLKSEFADVDQLKLHAMILEDLILFVVTNCDKSNLVDEFMSEFLRENTEFVNVAVHYLEPMGSVLIKTLKQRLPVFSLELESCWIKAYVYMANTVLSEDTDNESIATETSEVQPLFAQKSEPEVIQFSLAANEKYRGFRRNATNAPIPTSEPISLTVPVKQPSTKQSNISLNLASMLSSASLATYATATTTPFDPRKSRRTPLLSAAVSIYEDFEIPVKSPLRSASQSSSNFERDPLPQMVAPVVAPFVAAAQTSMTGSLRSAPSLMRKLEVSKQISDSEEEEESIMQITQKFDPRKKKHTRMDSIGSFVSLPESSEVDEQQDAKMLFKELPITPHKALPAEPKALPVPPVEQPTFVEPKVVPTPRFDYASFGIRGLAPISESVEQNEDVASSKYESDAAESASSHYGDDEDSNRTDVDISSTSASTLSLDNSDYRSSISSGTAHVDFKQAAQTTHREQKITPATPVSTAPVQSRFPSCDISSYSPSLKKQTLSPTLDSAAKMYTQSSPSSTTSLLLSKTRGTPNVSMGFMRSSFILKKEMRELGLSESAFTKPQTLAHLTALRLPSPSVMSLGSIKLNSSGSSCFDLGQSFDDDISIKKLEGRTRQQSVKSSPPVTRMRHAKSAGNLNGAKLTSNSDNAKLKLQQMKKDDFGYVEEKRSRSLRSRLSLMFSSKKSSRNSSSAGSISSGRISTMSSARFDSDNISINSVDSGASLSGFSFMTTTRLVAASTQTEARMRLAPRKANKYSISATQNHRFLSNN